MTLRILIADDEPLARARLRALVEELGHEVCAEAGDGTGAEHALTRARPDAVLLDIQMPGRDGLTMVRQMASAHPHLPVVFVTAHAEHAVTAFDLQAADYLLKPVRSERLAQALDRVIAARENSRTTVPILNVRVGRSERLIPLNTLDCLLAQDGYVLACTQSLEGFIDCSLREAEERWAPFLIRIHRSCLAVRSAILGMRSTRAGDHQLLFKDGYGPLNVSRRQVSRVRQFLSSRF